MVRRADNHRCGGHTSPFWRGPTSWFQPSRRKREAAAETVSVTKDTLTVGLFRCHWVGILARVKLLQKARNHPRVCRSSDRSYALCENSFAEQPVTGCTLSRAPFGA